MENRTEIGKAIKNKLSDLDKNPSDFVWSKIETDLNKKRNRRILFWSIPSMVVIALLSSLLYYNFDFQDKNQKQETQASANHFQGHVELSHERIEHEHDCRRNSTAIKAKTRPQAAHSRRKKLRKINRITSEQR